MQRVRPIETGIPPTHSNPSRSTPLEHSQIVEHRVGCRRGSAMMPPPASQGQQAELSCRNASLFPNSSYVCPEPGLVNIRVFSTTWRKKGKRFLTKELARLQGAQIELVHADTNAAVFMRTTTSEHGSEGIESGLVTACQLSRGFRPSRGQLRAG